MSSGQAQTTKDREVDNHLALTGAISTTPAVITPCIPDSPANLTEIFGRFLRLRVADGDASPATVRTYHAQATQFVTWCQQGGLNPATATEEDIIAYRKHLVEAGYRPTTTVALKLAVVRRLYEAPSAGEGSEMTIQLLGSKCRLDHRRSSRGQSQGCGASVGAITGRL